jgi:hypothetical protein
VDVVHNWRDTAWKLDRVGNLRAFEVVAAAGRVVLAASLVDKRGVAARHHPCMHMRSIEFHAARSDQRSA